LTDPAYATTATLLFGTSAFYHRLTWVRAAERS
jgi:hypothetical protein